MVDFFPFHFSFNSEVIGMKEREGDCKEAYREFQKQHSKFLRQPIVRSFLRDKNHYELVQQAVCSPTKENRQRVDEAFQSFDRSVKTLTYLSNLIHFNAINFDKTMKKHYNREILTLDQPLQEENGNEGATYKDMLSHPSTEMTEEIACETIADYVSNPQLYQAIQRLTSKQQSILTHRYVRGLQNKEIAELIGSSPQNVSKLHKRALQKLKDHLQKEWSNYDDN